MATPNAAIFGFVSADISAAARIASASLRTHGVRHALCGGLAVGAYGHVRATKAVDFLVGPEAFIGAPDGLVQFARGVPFRIGSVPTDAVPIPKELPGLLAALEAPDVVDGLPIVSPEALICVKLVAHRRKDQLDVIELLKAGVTSKPRVLRLLEVVSADAATTAALTNRLDELDALAADGAE
jgi:hypothetical protein